MSTLGEDLPREIARVRDEVMPVYKSIGPNGAPALALMQLEIDTAVKAMVEGDVVAMIRAYQSLQQFTT